MKELLFAVIAIGVVCGFYDLEVQLERIADAIEAQNEICR